MIFWILKLIFYIPYRIIFPTRIINRKELKKHRGKGVVFCCNHRSNTDPPTIFIIFNRKLHFLVKAGLMDGKLKHWFLSRLGCYPVIKGNDLALIRYSLAALKKNHAMMLFPEGMRVFNPDDALALRNGAAMIAIKAGVPIVPMVLKRAPRPFIPNAIKVGETIYTDEYQGKKLEKRDLEELSVKLRDSMADLLEDFEVKPKPKWWEKLPINNARGIVIFDEKSLLTIKRNKGGEDYYVLPGGHLEENENPRDTVVREIQEETSVKTAVIRLLYKHKYNSVKARDIGIENGVQSFFLCSYKSGTPQQTDAEEYTINDPEIYGTYEPTLIDLDDLVNINLRPSCVKAQLIKDLKKYGTRLTRSPKYLK